MQVWKTFRLIEESGAVNREIENYYVVAFGMHRPPTDGPDPNIWQEEDLLYKEYYHITAPFDLKNTISLKHRHIRDQAKDDDWVYSPAGRKIRKIIVKHEDAALDSGMLNDDYFGFSGYIRSYTWKLVAYRRSSRRSVSRRQKRPLAGAEAGIRSIPGSCARWWSSKACQRPTIIVW